MLWPIVVEPLYLVGIVKEDKQTLLSAIQYLEKEKK